MKAAPASDAEMFVFFRTVHRRLQTQIDEKDCTNLKKPLVGRANTLYCVNLVCVLISFSEGSYDINGMHKSPTQSLLANAIAALLVCNLLLSVACNNEHKL